MQKFLALTTLNALDPLPALGRKVEAKAPAINMAPSAEEVFERTPHELHPQRPGAARSNVDDLFDSFVAEPQSRIDAGLEQLRTGRFAFGATTCASRYGAALDAASRSVNAPSKLFRSLVPDGDQRDQGEGQSGHGDARGHEAGNLAYSGNAGSCERACREAKERFDASQGRAQGEARRASAVGSALTVDSAYRIADKIELFSQRYGMNVQKSPADWTRGLNRRQLGQAYEDRFAILDKPGERARCTREYFDALPFAHP